MTDEANIDTKRERLAQLEAALAEAGGRGVDLAEEIDKLRQEIGLATGEGPFTCRTCRSDQLVAWYPVYERQGVTITGLNEDGTLEIDYDGVTDTSDESGDNEEYRCLNCDDCDETLEALVGLPVPASVETWTWTGWFEGSDCDPEEPGKEWLTIEQDGEEYATIVLRTDASIFEGDPEALVVARAEREQRAARIVAALKKS